MLRATTAIVAFALLAIVSDAHAALQRVASLALPAGARPMCLALDGTRHLALIGTRATAGPPELFAIDLGDHLRSPALAWTLELGAKVHAIALAGDRALPRTGDDAAELVIVDPASGLRLGSFDADGAADGLSVKMVEPGVAKLGRRLSDAPEVYRLEA